MTYICTHMERYLEQNLLKNDAALDENDAALDETATGETKASGDEMTMAGAETAN